MNVSTMSSTMRFPLRSQTIPDLFEWLSFFGEILNLSSFDFDGYTRSFLTNKQPNTFPRKFVVVGRVTSFYQSVGKAEGNREDTQIINIENFTLFNSDVINVRVVLRELLVSSIKSLKVGDIICLIGPNLYYTPDGLTISTNPETILVHVKTDTVGPSPSMASEESKLYVLETRNNVYPKKTIEEQSSEDEDGSEDMNAFKKVKNWLYKSSDSLLSSHSSTRSDLGKLESEMRVKEVLFPRFDISASNFLKDLHLKYTTGGDALFIDKFHKMEEMEVKGCLSGFVIGVDPDLDSPMSILVGECKSGCGQVFPFPLLFQVASKFKFDICPHCDFSEHITCPDCSKNDPIPLCIYFSFKLVLFCGPSTVKISIENKEAEHFLDCTLADYLNNPEVQVKSLVNLYKLISHEKITSESTAVVLKVILTKFSNSQIYLLDTKLLECQVFYKEDANQQKSFVAYYKSLPEKPSTTIRFFNRTDYYTVHGADATFAAKEVFRTISFIKTLGSDKDTLDYLILNKSQFESFVRDLLLVKQYRVEVYTNKGNKAPNTWNLEFKGSPGNLSQFEEILFTHVDQLEGNSTISLKYDVKNKVTGIALIDTVDSKFFVAEIPDDEHFANLEAVIVQFTPKECVLTSESTPENDMLKKIVERCGVLVTQRKKSDYSTDGLVQDLNRLVKFDKGQQQNANTIAQMELKNAMSALAAGIKYLELSSDDDNFGKFTVETLEHGRFVHLDSAAVSSLSISANETHNSNMTITSLLDKCRTPHGHRLLQQWVKQPLRDINIISDRHDIVEIFVNDTILRQAIYEEHLKKFPDLQVLSKKLLRKKASMQDCYRIYQAIERIPPLISTLKENEMKNFETLREMIISPLEEHHKDMEKYQDMVVSTIDMSLVDNGEFLVKPEFDENLQSLRNQMDVLEEKLKVELNKVARDLCLEAGKSIKLESNSQYGYYFRDEKVIRGKSNYHQLDTNKNGIRFRNTNVENVNDEYITVREEYEGHQKAVVDEVIGIAVGYGETIKQISYTLAQLDVLCSFAVVAASAPKPYIRPSMKPKGSGLLNLTQVRHPCLEVLDHMSYIANDVNFNKDKLFYVITGPNMGGKSTYIRSIGVTCLLAHIGSFVPCDSAEISILDAILARVGANDSQLKGMSTFMVEMVEAASILKMATSDSLVIIDELGRGTSTYEGCGIAWAIADYLAKKVKPFCLFATHFHELTRLSDEIEQVENLHVTAVTSDDSLTLLYQVKPGACDQSFGIHVAQMAKIPTRVITDAKRKLEELEDFQSTINAEDDVKKRKIIQEGESIIKQVLDTIKTKDLKNLSDNELKEELEKIKAQVMSHDNSYIKILTQKPSECP